MSILSILDDGFIPIDLLHRTSHVHSFLGPNVEKFLREQSSK